MATSGGASASAAAAAKSAAQSAGALERLVNRIFGQSNKPTTPTAPIAQPKTYMGIQTAESKAEFENAPTAQKVPTSRSRMEESRFGKWMSEGKGKYITSVPSGAADALSTYTDPQGAIEAGKKRGGWLGGFQQAGGRAVAGLDEIASGNELRGAAQGMRGIGAVAGNIPVIGKPIEAFTKLGAVVFESIDKLKKWGDQMHQSNMRFAEYSGLMAQVGAEAQQREIRRSAKIGDERAASARELAEGQQKFKDAIEPVETAIGKFTNKVGGWALDKIGGGINALTGGVEENAKRPTFVDYNNMLDEMQHEPWFTRYAKPEDFRTPR